MVASQTLEILHRAGFVPTVIVTSPDRPAGRGMRLTETEVATWAKNNKIECLKPEKINKDFIEKFKSYKIDLSIVVAYGKILPEEIINLPRLGTLNIHYSLLPKYRGASPVEQALLLGETVTGVSIQQMEERLDSGPILANKELEIGSHEMKGELLSRLINLGAELLRDILPRVFESRIEKIKQDEGLATFCKKIEKSDGEIDPTGSPVENYNKYRAFEGWPGVYFFKNGKRIKITKAKFENGSFLIETVIPEGKKEIDWSSISK